MRGAKQDLSALSSSGSTARVLNLAAVFRQFGETREFSSRPLFRSQRLNKAIILKHTLRSHERERISSCSSTATKIVLPFDCSDLTLGGYSFLIGEPHFERDLRACLGQDTSDVDNRADLEVLKIIDELPSFDPFLLRERLKRSGFEPARCYFGLSEADATRMRSFVEAEIRKLVDLAFAGDPNVRNLSSRMAEKLMTDETATSLEPLRATLQLSGEEYREGVFAWKGFLYYSWSVGEFAASLPALSRQILSARILRATAEERGEINDTRRRVIARLSIASSRVREGIRSYKNAYEHLSAGKPAAFRDFLLRAPTLFLSVGEAISIIKHVDSFWRFRFKAGGAELSIDIEDARDVFQEFASQLAGIEEPEATGAASL